MDLENNQEHERDQRPLHELLKSPVVDITVGPESTHWSLHQGLLCQYSPFFASMWDKEKGDATETDTSYSLPDEDNATFELFVGWLYSKSIRRPETEQEIGPLLDLYLLSHKLQVAQLSTEVVDLVREYYHHTATYPGLRRVQYIYAETDEDNEMREMMVSSIAHQMTTSDKIPSHWAAALKRNGQLAVDIIRAIQQWKIEERSIPDVRDGSQTRGRAGSGGGFSAVEPAEDSLEAVDANLGVESLNSGTSDVPVGRSDVEENAQFPRPPDSRADPPDKDGDHGHDEVHETDESTLVEEDDGASHAKQGPENEDKLSDVADTEVSKSGDVDFRSWKGGSSPGFRLSLATKAESALLLSAWVVYFFYNVSASGKGATWS